MSGLPEEVWFGTIRGQWPIQCWESESHALVWLRDGKPTEFRTLWKAKISRPTEYEVVSPEPFLQPVPPPDAGEPS